MGLSVSIIVLLYKSDHEKLTAALRSVFAQSYDNTEVIVQDDGSPGFDCETINEQIQAMKPRFPVTVHSNEQNMGTVRSYNAALKMSTGEIIIPLAADDILASPDVIERITAQFDNKSCNICTAFRIGQHSGYRMPLTQLDRQ